MKRAVDSVWSLVDAIVCFDMQVLMEVNTIPL